MTNHPNRGRNPPALGRNPSPQEIVNARNLAMLTQPQAAKLIYKTLSVWKKWETRDINSPEHRRMPADTWELFLIKTGLLDQYLRNPNMFKSDLSTPDPAASKTSESSKRGG